MPNGDKVPAMHDGMAASKGRKKRPLLFITAETYELQFTCKREKSLGQSGWWNNNFNRWTKQRTY